MFDVKWFTKYQKLLLWFANSWIGRRILCINGSKSSVGKNKIIKILPSSITWKTGRKYHTEFRTHDKFGKRLYYAFYPIWKLAHLWDAIWYPKFNLGFDTLTTYPAAGANSPVDGRTYTASLDVDFATIRAAAGGAAEASGDPQEFVLLRATATSNQYQYLVRAFFLFDTSSLTSGATISASVLSLNGTAKPSGNGSNQIDIVSSSPASDNTLVVADHATLGTTAFVSISTAAYSTSAYNDFTLDANGIANISKTSISKFGARLGWDTANSFTGAWGSLQDTGFAGNYADAAGTSTDPKLVVTYISPQVTGSYAFII